MHHAAKYRVCIETGVERVVVWTAASAVERFVEGLAELVRLSYDTASSVQAGVASLPMTRAWNCVTSRMVSQFHKHVRLVKPWTEDIREGQSA
jgi:hypothetical protein